MDTQMDEHEVPLFDETNYSTWRIEMKGYLQEKGAGVWNKVVVGPIPSMNKSKLVVKKNNAVALKTIFNGLSDFVKERIRHHSSAKYIWLNLEKVYQDKKENEGKDSPKYFDNSNCNDVECSPAKEEEYREDVCVEFSNSYLIYEVEDLLNLKDKVLFELDDVSYEIGNN
jgi:hypothetical protein